MTSHIDWASLLFTKADPSAVWAGMFGAVADATVHAADAAALERSLTAGDNLLSAAAWDLWVGYAAHAPMMSQGLRTWWGIRAGSAGKAVLLLDALSVREMRILLLAAASHGIKPDAVQVHGAQAPTDTDATAHALGLTHRSQLKNSGYANSFALADRKPYTDMPEGVEFGQLVEHIPATRDIFLWCPWPDDLIHGQAGNPTGPANVVKTVTTTLSGDGFWRLVERLRQGRELLIASDHGYAISQQFVNVESPLADTLKATFKAQRCGKAPSAPFSQLGEQPMYIEIGARASVVGPWKWKVEGGFPHLGHGGLTLAEVCVPFLLFPAL